MVALPQNDCVAVAVGAAGKAFMVTVTVVLELLTHKVVVFSDSA